MLLLLACTLLKSFCKGNLLDRLLFASDSSLLPFCMLLLELSLIDCFEEFTLSKLLNFKDLVSLCDKFGNFNFYFGSVNVKRLPLLNPTSIVISLKVDEVKLFQDESFWKIILGDDLSNSIALENLHLLRATDATSKWEDSTLSRV